MEAVLWEQGNGSVDIEEERGKTNVEMCGRAGEHCRQLKLTPDGGAF